MVKSVSAILFLKGSESPLYEQFASSDDPAIPDPSPIASSSSTVKKTTKSRKSSLLPLKVTMENLAKLKSVP